MPTSVNTASAFTITELNGRERQVRLVERGLPYRPFDLGTTQRVSLTWYPGSPEATSTLTGRSLQPTQLHGTWKDKYISSTPDPQSDQALALSASGGLGGGDFSIRQNELAPITLNGTQVSNVRDAIELFEKICEEGALLEVTWDEQTRHGHLEKINASWQNRHDVGWSMSFVWINKGEATVPGVFISETSLSDTSGRFESLNAELTQEALPIPFSPEPDFFQALQDGLAAIESQVEDSLNTVSALIELTSSPFDAVRRMVAITTSLMGECDILLNLMASQTAAAFDFSYFSDVVTAGANISMPSFGSVLVQQDYARRVAGKTKGLRAEAIRRRASLTKQINNQLLGIVTTRAGQDLRDISNQFYGTPFEWRRLLMFNELNTPALVAGQVLLIPQVTGPDAGVGC